MKKIVRKIIVGSQWGDEGKGKMVDLFSDGVDYCVRFQGGSNAGHTIIFEGSVYKLRLLPSGVLRGATGILTSNVVVDLDVLKKEIKNTKNPKVLIDKKAIIVLPIYKTLDVKKDKSYGGIGTTGNGIGIAYSDKVNRCAFRMEDLLKPISDWQGKLKKIWHTHSNMIGHDSVKWFTHDMTVYLKDMVSFYSDKIIDTGELIFEEIKNNKSFVVEGGQGTLLDINHGTYPFVTSSNTLATSVETSIGCHFPKKFEHVGVFKAYCTRVGNGDFEGELDNDLGDIIRGIGKEYGVVTGRDRRCGWLSLPLLRYAQRLNGFDFLCMTKSDVLDGFDDVKLIDLDGKLKSFKGWDHTYGKKDFNSLDCNLISYIDYIEKQIEVPILIISTGADREQTIIRGDLF